jgi:hypothetical protein
VPVDSLFGLFVSVGSLSLLTESPAAGPLPGHSQPDTQNGSSCRE